MDPDPFVSKGALLAPTVIPLFPLTLMKISDEFVVLQLQRQKKKKKNYKKFKKKTKQILIHLSPFDAFPPESLT